MMVGEEGGGGGGGGGEAMGTYRFFHTIWVVYCADTLQVHRHGGFDGGREMSTAQT